MIVRAEPNEIAFCLKLKELPLSCSVIRRFSKRSCILTFLKTNQQAVSERYLSPSCGNTVRHQTKPVFKAQMTTLVSNSHFHKQNRGYLRVYGKSAHLHLKFAQNSAVKLAVEFCRLQLTPKYSWKWMPKSMRYKIVIARGCRSQLHLWS